MAARIDAQAAPLESERATLVAEKEEALASTRALKAAMDTITAKDREVVVAQATLAAAEAKAVAEAATRAEADTALRSAREETEAALQAAREKGKKAAEDEFAARFFQGYSDLKRRVAEDHPEWDWQATLGWPPTTGMRRPRKLAGRHRSRRAQAPLMRVMLPGVKRAWRHQPRLALSRSFR